MGVVKTSETADRHSPLAMGLRPSASALEARFGSLGRPRQRPVFQFRQHLGSRNQRCQKESELHPGSSPPPPQPSGQRLPRTPHNQRARHRHSGLTPAPQRPLRPPPHRPGHGRRHHSPHLRPPSRKVPWPHPQSLNRALPPSAPPLPRFNPPPNAATAAAYTPTTLPRSVAGT